MSETHQSEYIVSDKMQSVIRSIRLQLNMDIAFISDFVGDHSHIQFVDGDSERANALRGIALPNEQSYCHLIANKQLPAVMPDVSEIPLARSLQSTHDLSIGAYLATPLRNADDQVYGMFCCVGHKPQYSLSERDLALMQVFADMAGAQISERLESRHAHQEVSDRVQDVMSSGCLSIAYQPIYNVTKKEVIGFEALSRFNAEPYRSPDVWFKDAIKVGLGESLEFLAIKQAITALAKFKPPVYLSLNVSPEAIMQGNLNQILSDEEARRIVLEITEHTRVTDYEAFRQAIQPLREKGVRLAVDDTGAGFASFQHVLELGADIIKLDISLIKGIDIDPARSALASGLMTFSEQTSTRVIAEGVETREEFEELCRIGVHKVQGYFIGRPMTLDEAIRFQPQID